MNNYNEFSLSNKNHLICGDNLQIMKKIEKEIIDLIYIDPPFFSGRKHIATSVYENSLCYFSDNWNKDIDFYIDWLKIRLLEMKRILKTSGSIFVHCDYNASHYIKILMDEIYGKRNFINEIIWCFKSGGAKPNRRFSRKHNTILFYSKSDNYYFLPQKEKSYNRGFKPYRFAGVQEYQDEIGWYTLVGMKDYWEIDMVGRTSTERIGYPTQKPEKLIERIILSSCPDNGVVADFFVGSGTTAVVAERLGFKWFACDQSSDAIKITENRLNRLRFGK